MIFVDTSFWIAIHMPRDRHHEAATALLRSHSAQELATSNHVRGETWTYLRRKAGHAYAVAFLRRLEESRRFRVLFATEQDEQESLRWLRAHDEREYSFVDATSFVLMSSRDIRDAFAFDGDFAAAGFVELRP